MNFSDDILRFDEKAIMRLRTLYRRFGYSQYSMSRFEQYGIYAENKSFLASESILTFTDADGKLMALRPDVTLSIVKGIKDGGTLNKLYYNENVYRPDGTEFRERMQAGLECIGNLDVHSVGEVIALASESLKTIGGENVCLDISHMGFIGGFLSSGRLLKNQESNLLRLMSEKNVPELYKYCAENNINEAFCANAAKLSTLYGTFEETIETLRELSCCIETDDALSELEDIFAFLQSHNVSDDIIKLDFSIVNDLNYYSGVIFQGYIEGISEKVLSGGRYDSLLRKFGKRSGAVGFAVYLDLLERLSHGAAPTAKTDTMINIALPKGRLGEKAYSILEASGYGCPEILEDNRKLVFENKNAGVRYFWVKPSDVPIYVERGVADIGVAGKDILLEFSPDIYELLDLRIGKCRMCAATVKGFINADEHERTLKVATKFPKIARNYYEKNGVEIDIIKLNGSIEIAPLLGLSDVIVDIVETGKTLSENNLEPFDTIVDISARLIANKASYKFQYDKISGLCRNIEKCILP